MMERLEQIKQVFEETRNSDPRLLIYMAAGAVVGLAIPLVVGVVIGNLGLWGPIGVATAVLGAVLVFTRRASSAQYDAIEGEPGAAAAVLNSLRGWHVTPVVVATRKQDLVHRAVGKPGVVLVGEGSPGRVSSLLEKEREKMGRVVGDTPVHTIAVGDGEDQVGLRRLRRELAKLPNELKKKDAGELGTRLDALAGSQASMPKGPIPRGGRPR